MSDRYVCIHGHFYQPPRENPWLEAIEQQDSARPYHDWNQRISAECYAPNATARILDGEGRIASIANNYARISFNFGPTLLSWMEEADPDAYLAILEADRESVARFDGHGSAMAQAYNHMIMPLASQRDKVTQVRWGIADFCYRFGRDPEGMWLPETAVDTATLETLAAEGIRFTVLAPHQAKRVRTVEPGPVAPLLHHHETPWHDTPGGQNLDGTMPYLVRLPSGRQIALFFYHGAVSRAVAFEGLLRDGAELARRLLTTFASDGRLPQLVHIATDGETYGHHHRYGDMALAYALHSIETTEQARLTNYGEFLEICPPTHESEIVENTAWSCAHGIERWRNDCGCNVGGPGGHQRWRAPLRAALDWLREQIDPLFERAGGDLFQDPWAARDAYIRVILERTPQVVDAFLGEHAAPNLTEGEVIRALKLMEMQRHRMLMYTSCGWFFDDIAGIETAQVIQYAGRALQLAQEVASSLAGTDLALEPAWEKELEYGFLERLEAAPSNAPEYGSGRGVYERLVRPARLGLHEVAAHFAVSSLFEEYAEQSRLFCYVTQRLAMERREAGENRLLVGKARVTSMVTRESASLNFGVLHMGGHSISCGIHPANGDHYQEMVRETGDAFARADFAEVIRSFDRHFGRSTYSLRALFKDEQRKVLNQVLRSTAEEAESLYRQLYQHHAATLRFLASLGVPAPRGLATAAEFLLNRDLEVAVALDPPEIERANTLWDEAEVAGTPIDTAALGFVLQQSIEREASAIARTPWQVERLHVLDNLVTFASKLGAEVNLWRPQNVCYALRESRWLDQQDRARQGDQEATAWCEAFAALAGRLYLHL